MSGGHKRVRGNCQGRREYRRLIGEPGGIRSSDVITNARSLVTRAHYAYERHCSLLDEKRIIAHRPRRKNIASAMVRWDKKRIRANCCKKQLDELLQ